MAAPLRFQRSRRLSDARQFQAVFGAKVKKVAGPLIIWGKPNDRPYWRLGLSVGKRVGNAVARNRAKRLIREAFRLEQQTLPLRQVEGGMLGYDIVVSIRGPEVAEHAWELRAFVERLGPALEAIHREWQRREARRQREEQEKQ